MTASGQNVFSEEFVDVEFGAAIDFVDPILGDPAEPDVFLAPGFIDLQVNGFAGVDFNSPATSKEELARAIEAVFSTGVTRFFPTVITGDPQDMQGALRNLAEARESLSRGLAMEAFHLEGPHIAPEDAPRGAHPKQWVRPPSIDEYRRMQDAAQGNIRLITLAPEWPGSAEYIDAVTREGVVVAIGHTRASAAQIREAVAAGATMSTHLGNGAGSADRQDEFIVEQLLHQGLAASFIVDGHHLPGDFLKHALKTNGLERSILVTDAVAPALCSPGDYMLGSVEVELLPDDRVVLRGSHKDESPATAKRRLAGSALRMDRAIGNVMRIAGVTLSQAITMATMNPARVGRVPGRLRGIRPGERADLVRFRVDHGTLRILEVFFSGNRVFSA
jgi:N-acetylglucosamine-6-phosphate deacetylase